MIRSVVNDIIFAWRKNSLNKIIIINVVFFLLVHLIRFGFRVGGGGELGPLYYKMFHALCISNDLFHDIIFPWTWISHMFLHEGLFHLLFNMLYIYWFGKILGDFLGDSKLLPIYLICGLAGAVSYIVFSFIIPGWPSGSFALGASAAAMGILWATVVLSPDYEISLILIGPIKIKWIALFLLLFDIMAVTSMQKTGGHFAHIGGAVMGGLLISRLRMGHDLITPVELLLSRITSFLNSTEERARQKSKSKLHIVHKSKGSHASDNVDEQNEQDHIDDILDKISEYGYDSLTQEEKDYLENASKS